MRLDLKKLGEYLHRVIAYGKGIYVYATVSESLDRGGESRRGWLKRIARTLVFAEVDGVEIDMCLARKRELSLFATLRGLDPRGIARAIALCAYASTFLPKKLTALREALSLVSPLALVTALLKLLRINFGNDLVEFLSMASASFVAVALLREAIERKLRRKRLTEFREGLASVEDLDVVKSIADALGYALRDLKLDQTSRLSREIVSSVGTLRVDVEVVPRSKYALLQVRIARSGAFAS